MLKRQEATKRSGMLQGACSAAFSGFCTDVEAVCYSSTIAQGDVSVATKECKHAAACEQGLLQRVSMNRHMRGNAGIVPRSVLVMVCYYCLLTQLSGLVSSLHCS